MTANPSLLNRLEAADAGSRELDAEIAKALGWTDYREFVPMGHGWKNWWKDATGKTRPEMPEWTASIDAALDLVREVLPGKDIDLEIDDCPSAHIGQGEDWPGDVPFGMQV